MMFCSLLFFIPFVCTLY